ncbi:hypothetical protein CCB80_05740 [Armatimonadetes bacterium Uphvl-Ar1]|nr:hypothetical protein CCB80_05740 [Armatimonadetes bacterium Uphvl-Ar1]
MSTQTQLTIKPVVSDDEFQIYALLTQNERPDMIDDVESMKKYDAARPATAFFERNLIWSGDEPQCGVTMLQVYWSSDPTLFEIWLRPKGTVTSEIAQLALASCTEKLLAQGAKKINVWTPNHHSAWISELESNGYQFDQANPESVLMLNDLDTSPFESNIQAVLDSGLKITSMADYLAQNPETGWKTIYEMDMEILQDVPLPYEFTGEPLETYIESMTVNKDSFNTIHFAQDGDRLVGTSMLFRSKVAKEFYHTGLTGVLREYRRRGIASALKVTNFKLAKEAGGKQITCDNEEKNPMLQLNYQLGFKPYWVWHSYTKVL